MSSASLASLQSAYQSAASVLATATLSRDVRSLSTQAAAASATLAYQSNWNIAQTATNAIAASSASLQMAAASSVIVEIDQAGNMYSGLVPSFGGNLALAVVMGIFLVVHVLVSVYSKQWWFGICFFCGVGLEVGGYVSRTVGHNQLKNEDAFLAQFICLTLAPVFIMAALYYLLSKLATIYGEGHSKLKPMWYANIFICCDVISIVIQAAGGGIAGVSLQEGESTEGGTHVMVAGLAFQVFSMTVFIVLFLDFLYSVMVKAKKAGNDASFNPRYADIRSRKLFRWFPLGLGASVLFIYVRCIYRVAELSEGWSGHLIVHEIYFMILDALMMCLAIIIMIPFHPGFVFGRDAYIPVKGMKLGIRKEDKVSPGSGSDEKGPSDEESHGVL